MALPHVFRRAALEAEGQGGFHEIMSRHVALFFPRGPRLVVTFDNLKTRDQPAPRYPWGYDFLRKSGLSQLSLSMRRRNDWFRHGDVFDFFDRLTQTGWFDGFEDVVFYGSSMGGYGALTFCRAAPGARVVAMVPQTSLDPAYAPWEHRFRAAYERGDWNDERYLDGAEGAASARHLTLLYDPWFAPDRRHIDRLPDVPRLACHTPHLGHRAPRLLHGMGMLGRFGAEAVAGRLTQARYRALYADRKGSQIYCRQIARRALERGHPGLAKGLIDRASEKHGWRFPSLRREIGATREADARVSAA